MSSEFDKSLQELLHFGDYFKRREKQLKQQYNKQKNEFNVQLQKEKERIEQLQDKNRALIHQIEEMTEKQINFNATLNTKFNNDQIKETKPSNLIQFAEKAILENQKLKKSLTERDNEILQLNKQFEERLLQLITKVKTEFEIMYTKQSKSFLEKIDLLKEEQYLHINKQ